MAPLLCTTQLHRGMEHAIFCMCMAADCSVKFYVRVDEALSVVTVF